MGRHHFPEPRPTAVLPTTPRPRSAGDQAATDRPRRRIRARVVTLAVGTALAVGFIPGAVPTAAVGETPQVVEAGAMSAWKKQKKMRDAETVEPVRRASRASRPGAAAKPATTPTTTSAAPADTAVPSTSARTTTTEKTTTEKTRAESTPAATESGMLSAAGGAVGGVMTSAAEIASRPTSGAAWNALLTAANNRSGSVNLGDQESTHAARTLAAALVFARTGDAAQRAHVTSVLRQLPGSSLSGARVLSVGRQLGGYVVAADLIGYRDAAFTSWVGAMRTKDIGGHGRWKTINGTSENSGSNWGTWAMSTRVAISAYLGDRADLERAALVFRGFTGERSAYAGFQKTSDFDASWACGDAWVPINPASCGDKGGAIVEDISRSEGSYPSVDSTGLTYSWEVLGGATLSARLLERAGFRDVWTWGDRALLRAAGFLHANGGYAPQYKVNQYIPHEINNAYGADLGPVSGAGYGRQFGFSDWLS